jgi:hypothetical protein
MIETHHSLSSEIHLKVMSNLREVQQTLVPIPGHHTQATDSLDGYKY